VRRGGSRQDSDHHLLAVWAVGCVRAMHVLHFFEEAQPDDDRPRRAIELTHAWVRGEITMTQARSAALAANAARQGGDRSREGSGPCAGQAAAVAHVQLTSLVQRPTRSGRCGPRLAQTGVTRRDDWSVSGNACQRRLNFDPWRHLGHAGVSIHVPPTNARNFPTRSGNLCWTTSGRGTRRAGHYSRADQPKRTFGARTRAPLTQLWRRLYPAGVWRHYFPSRAVASLRTA
jgi:hypothetical protein